MNRGCYFSLSNIKLRIYKTSSSSRGLGKVENLLKLTVSYSYARAAC